jgi:hypothetical protein
VQPYAFFGTHFRFTIIRKAGSLNLQNVSGLAGKPTYVERSQWLRQKPYPGYLEIFSVGDDDEVAGEICRLYECPRPCTNSDQRTSVAEVRTTEGAPMLEPSM